MFAQAVRPDRVIVPAGMRGAVASSSAARSIISGDSVGKELSNLSTWKAVPGVGTTAEGASATTQMPLGKTSSASPWVKRSRAAFAVP